MKLTYEQIKMITKGAVRVELTDGKINFYRFTKEQEDAYYIHSPNDFYLKTFGTAGVRLEFMTDSESLKFHTEVKLASTRRFFAHDVIVNGELLKSFHDELAPDRDLKEQAFEISLPKGEKKVCIVFPMSVASRLISLELDDGASIEPVSKTRKMLIFGDSITHGYDATVPSMSYASKITAEFDAEAYNKAIGGEEYWPPLASLKDDIAPDFITVAYGSNDWSHSPKENFEKNSRGFYENLRAVYPGVKIFALAPIWRLDYDRENKGFLFSDVSAQVHKIAQDVPDMVVIDCFDFVPHDISFYYDKRLHPNNEGFAIYAEKLIAAMKEKM